MKQATLIRFNRNEPQTLGKLTIEGRSWFTMELPWLNNERGKSCISVGTYEVVPWNSPKFGKCFKIRSVGQSEVQGRSDVLMHPANFSRQLRGCIAPGKRITKLDKDSLYDVANSRLAMDEIMLHAPNGFTLTISDSSEFYLP